MPSKEMSQVRKQLEAKLSNLHGLHLRRGDLVATQAHDSLDQAQTDIVMDQTVRAINADWQTTKEVRTALSRVQSDAYGFCEECGDRIPARRLDAIPWASRCAPCQSGIEEEQGTPWTFAAGPATRKQTSDALGVST